MCSSDLSLHRLLGNSRSQRALVAMFLALLELVRLQAILLLSGANQCTISGHLRGGFGVHCSGDECARKAVWFRATSI